MSHSRCSHKSHTLVNACLNDSRLYGLLEMEMASEESGLGVLANAKKPTVPFHPTRTPDTAPCRAECRCRRKKVPDGRVQSVRQDAATAACRWRQGQALQSYGWTTNASLFPWIYAAALPSHPPSASLYNCCKHTGQRKKHPKKAPEANSQVGVRHGSSC